MDTKTLLLTIVWIPVLINLLSDWIINKTPPKIRYSRTAFMVIVTLMVCGLVLLIQPNNQSTPPSGTNTNTNTINIGVTPTK